MLRTKRVYEEPSRADGVRVLIDRLWPRGLSKEKARVDHWLRDLSPSDELRRWYHHDPSKWGAFRERYFWELSGMGEPLETLKELDRKGTVTLVYASKEERFNNAAALVEYLSR